MTRRIFVAIFVNDDIKKEIVHWQMELGNLPARWIALGNVHLTIIPPWNSSGIAKAMNELDIIKGAIKPFVVKFDLLKYGPNSREPRMIWAEGQASADLSKLKEAVENALAMDGSRRSFRPHLTLARFNLRRLNSTFNRNLDEKIDWRLAVDKVSLAESFLEPEGARYEILHEVYL